MPSRSLILYAARSKSCRRIKPNHSFRRTIPPKMLRWCQHFYCIRIPDSSFPYHTILSFQFTVMLRPNWSSITTLCLRRSALSSIHPSNGVSKYQSFDTFFSRLNNLDEILYYQAFYFEIVDLVDGVWDLICKYSRICYCQMKINLELFIIQNSTKWLKLWMYLLSREADK